MELSVTNETQILTSPNYPLPYGNNLICTWSLALKRFNRVFMLRFIDLDLENTIDCLSDYLEIRYSPVNISIVHRLWIVQKNKKKELNILINISLHKSVWKIIDTILFRWKICQHISAYAIRITSLILWAICGLLQLRWSYAWMGEKS